MTMPSWIRKVFTRPDTRPTRKPTHRIRLAVEALEARMVPSAVTVSNLTDDVNADTSSLTALSINPGADGISLREAVMAANNTAGADTIDFDPTLFGTHQTMTLTNGQVPLTDAATTTISGPGENL